MFDAVRTGRAAAAYTSRMKPRVGSFLEYIAAAMALEPARFSALRLVQQRKALARRLGRDELAEERWYGEGGNTDSRP
jgi:hypothetical protein